MVDTAIHTAKQLVQIFELVTRHILANPFQKQSGQHQQIDGGDKLLVLLRDG